MEAAAQPQRPIEGEKAQRIVEAMRSSVARRGVAGSTFDHVAREARVSRGLLHYYFGTKERLLAEVVRRDCELRMVALDEQLAGAHDADGVIDALVQSLRRFVKDEPEFITVVFELFTLSRRNDEIAVEFAELLRRTRERVAELLARKQAEGALRLRAEPGAVADVLFSLADGVSMRMLTETEHDFSATIAAGVLAVRALLD
jgi:AcrR family transcriptional regulator